MTEPQVVVTVVPPAPVLVTVPGGETVRIGTGFPGLPGVSATEIETIIATTLANRLSVEQATLLFSIGLL